MLFSCHNFRGNRSRIRTKPAQTTTDKHKFTQIDINNQSVFIRVHLWFKLPFSKCRERLQKKKAYQSTRQKAYLVGQRHFESPIRHKMLFRLTLRHSIFPSPPKSGEKVAEGRMRGLFAGSDTIKYLTALPLTPALSPNLFATTLQIKHQPAAKLS